MNIVNKRVPFTAMAIAMALLAGCSEEAQPETANADTDSVPRPVNVLRITKGHRPVRSRISASVDAWKQEEIGFQVAGRVRQVIESGREIQGRIYDGSGQQLLAPGTVIAQLEDERLRVAVQSAEAAVEVAQRRKEAVELDIETRFPARMRSQNAELALALREKQRAESLSKNNAISRSEQERIRTAYETAQAALAMIDAEKNAREAELRSLEASILKEQSALNEARLNLRDAKLYSSFRGQVAQVHVAPGSYVNEGDPVATVQMMDPIKVEFEVSAEMARQFGYADMLRVFIDDSGTQTELPGFVLMTDPVADPNTRTFTVSTLVRNEPKLTPVPPELQSTVVARTHDLWPVRIEPLIGVGPTFMMEENAIRHDAEGAFIWLVTNRRVYEVRRYTSELKVTKTRVKLSDKSVPFLNWKFVPIQFVSEVNFDPERALFAGDLIVSEGQKDDWDGEVILFDDETWTLRPGDTVQVEHETETPTQSFYVPVKAIAKEGQQSYLFVVQESDGEALARRIDIRLLGRSEVHASGSTLVAVDFVDSTLPQELQLIVEGTHYLKDGDAIAVANQRELQ